MSTRWQEKTNNNKKNTKTIKYKKIKIQNVNKVAKRQITINIENLKNYDYKSTKYKL